ncbi:hypothetical protein PG993_006230 [Apiospora rasikravindrae]|uniref:Ankyrin n=1 Tax=Apiospora rasikravindrae TaxID=990691 RepID=A0ABR1T5L2_9PEZI
MAIAHCEGGLIEDLIFKHINANHKDLDTDVLLLTTFQRQPFHVCFRALERLEGYGADMNTVITSQETLRAAKDAVGDEVDEENRPRHMAIPRFGRQHNSQSVRHPTPRTPVLLPPQTFLEFLSERFEIDENRQLFERFPQMRITERVVFRVVESSNDVTCLRHCLEAGPSLHENGYRKALIRYTALYARDKRSLPAVLEHLPPCSTGGLEGLEESLIVSALSGDLERIRELVVTAEDVFDKRVSELFLSHTSNGDPTSEDSWIIYGSIKAGQQMTALTLVQAGFAQDQDSTYNGMSLCEALELKNATLVRSLLRAGVNPTPSFSDVGSPMDIAVRNGSTQFIEDLLEAGASVNFGPIYPLAIAFRTRNLQIAKFLLDRGADINFDSSGNILRAAIKTLDLEIIQFAFDHGADTDEKILRLAAESGRDIFNLVVKEHKRRWGKIRKDWGDMILRLCLDNRDMAMFRDMVLSQMADTHCYASQRDIPGEDALDDTHCTSTVFGEAILRSRYIGLEPLDLLLQNKERLNCWPDSIVASNANHVVRREPPQTAFLIAIGTGHLPTVELLLRHNARLSYSGGIAARRTPFQKACEVGNMDIINLLLSKGAQVDEPAAYNSGATALQLAAIQGFLPLAKLLIEKGADVDAPPAKVNGVTALEGAAQHGRLDTVALLLGAGAADHGRDERQIKRAIQHARDEGHVVVEKLLKGYLETGVVLEKMGFYPDLVDLEGC